MTDGDHAICGKCGARNAADANFCMSCGARMVSAPPSGAPSAAPPPPAAAAFAPAAVGEGRPCPPPGDSAVPFVFAVCSPDAFCKGQAGVFVLRFRALADVFESVSFALVHGRDAVRNAAIDGRPGIWEHEVIMDVQPETPGQTGFVFEVRCRRDGYADDEWEVYASAPVIVTVDVAPVAQNLNIDLGGLNVIAGQSDRAADSKAVNNQVFNISSSAVFDPNSPRYRKGVRAGDCRMHLKSAPRRLTLHSSSSSRTLLLLSKNEISFGRKNEATDVSIRCFGDGGECDIPLSKMVSRRHFAISYDGMECRISDLGSTKGTVFDGRTVAPGMPKRIKPDVRHSLTVAIMPDFSMDAYCDRLGITTGLSIDRTDGARQRVFAVWRMGVPAGNGGGEFGWNGKYFVFSRAGGGCNPLLPGMSVEIDGETYDVQVYNQPYGTE